MSKTTKQPLLPTHQVAERKIDWRTRLLLIACVLGILGIIIMLVAVSSRWKFETQMTVVWCGLGIMLIPIFSYAFYDVLCPPII